MELILNKNKKAFTLIELLVTITIVGVLSSIAVINLSSTRDRARAGKIISEIKQIDTALRVFWAEKGHWVPECEIQDIYYDVVPDHALFCEDGQYPYGSSGCSLSGRGGCGNDPEPTMQWFVQNTSFSQFFPVSQSARLANYSYDNDNDEHFVNKYGCIRQESQTEEQGNHPGDPPTACNTEPYKGASLYVYNVKYQSVVDQVLDGGDGGCCGKFLYDSDDIANNRGIWKLGFSSNDF